MPRESLGTLSLSDFLLEPSFVYTEPRHGRFAVDSAYLAVRWTRDRLLSATVKFGSLNLLGVPARYDVRQENEFGLVEGYAQVDSVYGRVRLGLVPIPFGSEGGDVEPRLSFPRSLLYKKGLVGLRDYGVSYRVSNAGFFSDWAIHNGEGGPDLDNEAWFTARWGYQGGQFFRVGASGTTGRTSPLSTNSTGSASSALAGIDVDRPAKIRVANLFFDWEVEPIRVEMETSVGETSQEESNQKLRAVHIDFEFAGAAHLAWLARYDVFDPHTDQSDDRIDEYTTGIAWRGRYETSALYVLGTKSVLQNGSADVHSVRVLWRMTPSAMSIRSPL